VIAESFWILVRDPGHWLFEVVSGAVLDGLILGVFWRRVRAHIHRDIEADRKARQPSSEWLPIMVSRDGEHWTVVEQ
jgi:hypothetical protein